MSRSARSGLASSKLDRTASRSSNITSPPKSPSTRDATEREKSEKDKPRSSEKREKDKKFDSQSHERDMERPKDRHSGKDLRSTDHEREHRSERSEGGKISKSGASPSASQQKRPSGRSENGRETPKEASERHSTEKERRQEPSTTKTNISVSTTAAFLPAGLLNPGKPNDDSPETILGHTSLSSLPPPRFTLKASPSFVNPRQNVSSLEKEKLLMEKGQLEIELERMKLRYQNEKKQRQKLSLQVEEQAAEIQALDAKIKEQAEKEMKLRRHMREIRQERLQFEEKALEMEDKVKSLTEKLRRARDAISNVQQGTSEIESQVRELETNKRALEKEILKLKRELREEKRKRELADDKVADLEEKARFAEERAVQAEDRAKAMAAEIKALQKEIQELRNKKASDSEPFSPHGPVSPKAPFMSEHRGLDPSKFSMSRWTAAQVSVNAAGSDSVAEKHSSCDAEIKAVLAKSGGYQSVPATAQLLRLIFHPPDYEFLDAVFRLTATTEMDRVVKAVITLYGVTGGLLPLLKHWIHLEVESTRSEAVNALSTLFRANSIASKMLSTYFKKTAVQYLQEILAPCVEAFIQKPVSVELDTFKNPNIDVARNAANLKTVAKSFLDRIKNPDAMPWDIRELCATLKREVDKKFPGYGTASIGGVLFLRFICPVLVTPDYFGLCSAEKLTPELRRGLLLISKTIQKVANEDSTQTKEDQMIPLVDFVLENRPQILAFFEAVAAVPPVPPTFDPTLHFKEDETWTPLFEIHTHLTTISKKLQLELEDQATVKQFTEVMKSLGEPQKPALAAAAAAAPTLKRTV